jgi:hypothetical protein
MQRMNAAQQSAVVLCLVARLTGTLIVITAGGHFE